MIHFNKTLIAIKSIAVDKGKWIKIHTYTISFSSPWFSDRKRIKIDEERTKIFDVKSENNGYICRVAKNAIVEFK